MALFDGWFVFHCHGNETKISSKMADIGAVIMNVRPYSSLTADILVALFIV
jgi:hypothetical protein